MAPTSPSGQFVIVHEEYGPQTGEVWYQTADGYWWMETQSPHPPLNTGEIIANLRKPQ